MGGLLVLLLIGLYLWIAYKVVLRIKPMWGGALAVADEDLALRVAELERQ